MKNLFILITAILFVSNINAQSPDKMSYQAVVRNVDNTPVANQSVGVQISILQGSATGAAVFVERHSIMTNVHGLMSLSIGEGAAVLGAFSSIDWTVGPYFILTETDPSGRENYTISGASQLLSVPYALHAKTAENFSNDQVDDADADPTNELQNLSLTGTTLNISDGSGVDLNSIIPPGGTDDQTAAEVNYNNSASGLTAGNVQNAIDELAAGSTVNTDNQELSYNSSTHALSIDRGNSVDLSDLATDGDDWGSQVVAHDNSIKGEGTAGNPIGLARQGATNDQVLKWNGSAWVPGDDAVGTGGSLWTESGTDIYFNTGNVGVGTLAPEVKLHVNSPDPEALRIESSQGGVTSEYHTSSGRVGYVGSLFNGNMDFGTVPGNTTGRVYFRTQGLRRLAISADGDIGIGTIAPAAKLDVLGGQWDVTNTEGDFRIGNSNYRLKIGVAIGGGGAGITRIRAVGGANQLRLGAGNSDVLTVDEDRVHINGEVNRPATGSANMLPIAYGYVTGSINKGAFEPQPIEVSSGSGNFQVFPFYNTAVGYRNIYVLQVDGESFSNNNYVAIVTPTEGGHPLSILVTSNSSNHLQISFTSFEDPTLPFGELVESKFSFVIYKP
ncbi:hypothetical protein E1176_19270 [Fulvivirga sp. RKSG066]|uniref:hypothetical protein n=1 Tax=Fulvivirga aurantia TaxID=2529383 RepID=UPI0012BCFA71|nr:hypothetical protein [Fulvivirga aurantia]MTI23179.1 hypothetical protein [Fulvivirga aurantia]